MVPNFTGPSNSNGVVTDTACYLPQSLVSNTPAAFNIGSGTFNPSTPYIWPCNTGGQV